MSTQPIAGNESFKNVNTLAAQLPELNVAEITNFHIDTVQVGGGSLYDPDAVPGEDNHLLILSGNPIVMGDCCSTDTTAQITIEQPPASGGPPLGALVTIGSSTTTPTSDSTQLVDIRGLEVQVQGVATGKLGFFATAPVVRPVNTGASASFNTNTSGIVNDTATFGGYTIGQVVQALQDLGLLT